MGNPEEKEKKKKVLETPQENDKTWSYLVWALQGIIIFKNKVNQSFDYHGFQLC